MQCDAKIRPFPAPSVELQCEHEMVPAHEMHHSTLRDYAHPGSATTLTWEESDRRTFRGDWIECPERGCVLPGGHPRGHAL